MFAVRQFPFRVKTLQTAVANMVVVWCTSRKRTKDNQGRKGLLLSPSVGLTSTEAWRLKWAGPALLATSTSGLLAKLRVID